MLQCSNGWYFHKKGTWKLQATSSVSRFWRGSTRLVWWPNNNPCKVSSWMLAQPFPNLWSCRPVGCSPQRATSARDVRRGRLAGFRTEPNWTVLDVQKMGFLLWMRFFILFNHSFLPIVSWITATHKLCLFGFKQALVNALETLSINGHLLTHAWLKQLQKESPIYNWKVTNNHYATSYTVAS